jgi:SecD/SecF fusion protein
VLLPILSLLFFGGDTLKDFAFAIFVGVATGTYSSVFIAAPVLTLLKQREPRYQQMEARRQVRQEKAQPSVTRGRAAAAVVDDNGEAVASVPAVARDAAAVRATARTGGSARPRPKSKRKPPAKRKRR